MREWTIKTVYDRCIDEGECKLWAQSLNSAGYPQATIGGAVTMVRRFVVALRLGHPIRRGYDVFATCDSRICCADGCLRLRTRSESVKHSHKARDRAVVVRTLKRNARAAGFAKLSDAQVAEIRERGSGSAEATAQKYGVTARTVRGIDEGRSHKQVYLSSVFDLARAA